MSCKAKKFHGEHYYENDHGNDAWCKGSYEVVATFGPWRIVLDPDDPAQGFIDTDPDSDLPTYYVESARVHMGEPDGHTWREQIAEKIWAKPYLADFTAALATAQTRWPRKKPRP